MNQEFWRTCDNNDQDEVDIFNYQTRTCVCVCMKEEKHEMRLHEKFI